MNLNNMTLSQQMGLAIGTAMDRGTPFSWVSNERACGNRHTEVQSGVYIRHNQDTFQRYVMPELAVRLQTT